MDLLTAYAVFFVGLAMFFPFTQEIVKGAVGAMRGLGVAAYFLSMILIGLDFKYLILGITGLFEGLPGIAPGAIVGASMMSLTLIPGATALFSPVCFQDSPRRILLLPLMSEVLFGLISLDGSLSRIDGAILLASFALSFLYILRLSKRGLDIKPSEETVSVIDKRERRGRKESMLVMLVGIFALIVASKLLVFGSKTILTASSLTDTAFGMTVLALLVGAAEISRQVPAAVKRTHEVSYGAVSGPVLTFFLFNAGLTASLSPIPVSRQVITFYLPVCMVATMTITFFMLAGKIPRAGGIALGVLYLVFFFGGIALA